jgi:hypothetical protein
MEPHEPKPLWAITSMDINIMSITAKGITANFLCLYIPS